MPAKDEREVGWGPTERSRVEKLDPLHRKLHEFASEGAVSKIENGFRSSKDCDTTLIKM